MVEIVTGFDGSCPRSLDDVRKDARDRFTVFPARTYQQGISNEWKAAGGRFYVRLVNPEDAPCHATVTADWRPATETADNYDFGFVRPEAQVEWRMAPGIGDGACVRYELDLAPGMTELGLYPAYNTQLCRRFVERAKSQGVEVDVVGKSREGREMWLLSIASRNPDAPNFLVQARDHAYETAGSYCVEGILRFLLSRDPVADYLRSKFNISILPMTNPDGVYNGLSRRTWEKGADMNRVHTEPDPAHDAVKKVIDRTRPLLYMNIHNFTAKFKDGLYAHDRSVGEKIMQHMPADAAHHKRWEVATHEDYLKAENVSETPKHKQSWKNYCADNFNAVCVTFELPWFGRETAAMRRTGRDAFTAMALAGIEERSL